jgi:hypothetical protein
MRGAAVHALLRWSAAHRWRAPSEELALREAAAAGLDERAENLAASLLEPVEAWLTSSTLRERVKVKSAKVRAEVPILLGVGQSVLRGSIDLLVAEPAASPLVIDYKTDRLGGQEPAEHGRRYALQRSIYALAVASSWRVGEVEVIYVFLERPEEPVSTRLGRAAIEAGREQLGALIARIGQGEFEAAAARRRDWALCGGCPALGELCRGPAAQARPSAPTFAPPS